MQKICRINAEYKGKKSIVYYMDTNNTEEKPAQPIKIICSKCDKPFTINHFRYRHNLKCDGKIKKDYARPIRKYNKTKKEIPENLETIPENDEEQQNVPILNLNRSYTKNITSILENTINKPIRKYNNYSNFNIV